MENPKKVAQNQRPEPVNIFALSVKYHFKNGSVEQSSDKYCGQSEDEALATISKMLGVCRSCLPESILKVSYTIKGFKRSSYESAGSPDILLPDVVVHLLRNYNEGCSE